MTKQTNVHFTDAERSKHDEQRGALTWRKYFNKLAFGVEEITGPRAELADTLGRVPTETEFLNHQLTGDIDQSMPQSELSLGKLTKAIGRKATYKDAANYLMHGTLDAPPRLEPLLARDVIGLTGTRHDAARQQLELECGHKLGWRHYLNYCMTGSLTLDGTHVAPVFCCDVDDMESAFHCSAKGDLSWLEYFECLHTEQ